MGAWARMRLKSMAATILMVGHMINTVQQDMMTVMKNGLSVPGWMMRSASLCPILLPHRLERECETFSVNM